MEHIVWMIGWTSDYNVSEPAISEVTELSNGNTAWGHLGNQLYQFETDQVQAFVLTELKLRKIHQTSYAYYWNSRLRRISRGDKIPDTVPRLVPVFIV